MPVALGATIAPAFRSIGAAAHGGNAIAPALPPNRQPEDVLLLAVESDNINFIAPEPLVPGQVPGWEYLNSQPTSGAGLVNSSRLTTYWARSSDVAGPGGPTIEDTGDHTHGVVVAFSGCKSGHPFNATASGSENSSTTSLAMSGLTTSVDRCRIVLVVVTNADTSGPWLSGVANTNLTELTEHYNAAYPDGSGGGLAIYSGILESAGEVGITTATQATLTNYRWSVFALEPAASEPEPPYLIPGPGWNGTSQSGYGGVLPEDATNTNDRAQGILRMITVPSVVIGEDLLVGVRGGAFDGYAQILCHCEGVTYDITEQTRQSFTDVNGQIQSLTGNFARLDRRRFPSGIYGEIALYFEGVPNNPNILRKVIGPFRYFLPDPADPKANRVILFGSAYPNDSTPGGPYRSLTAALAYARSQALVAPEVRCMTTGEYSIGALGGRNLTGTRIAITAAQGVTCTIGLPNQANDTGIRPSMNGLEFRGSNVVYDQKNILALWWEPSEIDPTENPHPQGTLNGQVANYHHFNGCVITNSMGRYPLWRGYTQGQPIAQGNTLYTECIVSNVRGDRSFQGAGLVRNCDCMRLPADVFVLANCAVGNRLRDCKAEGYASSQVSARVRYTGPGMGTIQRSGDVASAAGHLTVSDTEGQSFTIQTNTYVQSFVEGVNALQGWEAVNLYDSNWTSMYDRSLRAISVEGSGKQGNPFTRNLTADSGWLELVTSMDIHADMIQAIAGQNGLKKSNCVYADNVGYDMNWQFMLIQSTAATKAAQNWLIENNCSHIGAGFGSELVAQVQVWGVHLLIRHNSLPNQTISFNSGGTSLPYTSDGFCEFYGNVSAGIHVSPAQSDVSYGELNHSIQTPTGAGLRPAGTTTGGSMTSIIADAPNGDFSPQGDLLDHLIPPRTKFDALGNLRAPLDARGAVRAPV